MKTGKKQSKPFATGKMFDMPWVDLCWPNSPIEEDRTVAILIRHFGFYSLNAAQIVYVIDEWNRFGFAYGTLDDHGESGEERFSVEFDQKLARSGTTYTPFQNPAISLQNLAIR